MDYSGVSNIYFEVVLQKVCKSLFLLQFNTPFYFNERPMITGEKMLSTISAPPAKFMILHQF